MKLGVVLPTFRDGLHDALEVAQRCEELGLDGVFAYDHLWPMRSPMRPSFAPLPVLSRVSQLTKRLMVGPLVARVGMSSVQHLVIQLRTLEIMAPGRVIAALGTGDTLSRDELDAYGLPFAPAAERRAQLDEAARALRPLMPVWIGGGSPDTEALAVSLDVERNLWNADAATVAQAARSGPVNWAGAPADDLAGQVAALRAAGATWAIFAPSVDSEKLSLCRP